MMTETSNVVELACRDPFISGSIEVVGFGKYGRIPLRYDANEKEMVVNNKNLVSRTYLDGKISISK